MFSTLELPILHIQSTMVPCFLAVHGAPEAATTGNQKKPTVLSGTMGSSAFSPPQLPPPPLPPNPALATPIAGGMQPARARGSPRARRTNAATSGDASMWVSPSPTLTHFKMPLALRFLRSQAQGSSIIYSSRILQARLRQNGR